MNLTEEQIRAILTCSGFELAAPVVLDATGPHPSECACDACQRQSGTESKQ